MRLRTDFWQNKNQTQWAASYAQFAKTILVITTLFVVYRIMVGAAGISDPTLDTAQLFVQIGLIIYTALVYATYKIHTANGNKQQTPTQQDTKGQK